MNKIKGSLLFIIFCVPALLFAQEVKPYAVYQLNKIEYRKVYPSAFPGKTIIIKNWLSETFNFADFKETFQNNIIRFINSVPIEISETNYNITGELSCTINIWCKNDRFQLLINNLYYRDKESNESFPLELFPDSTPNKIILTFSINYIDSIINSFENYINPYLEKSPDIIVTKDFDTIKCNLINENNTHIKYSLYNHKDTTSHLADKSEIFSINKHEEITNKKFEEFPETNIYPTPKNKEQYKIYRSSLELDFGYSRRVSPMSQNVASNMKDYIDGLRNGYGIAFNYNYYFINNIGIGLNMSGAFSSDSTSYLYYSPYDNSASYRSLKEKIEIIIIAPSFSYRIISNNNKTIFHPKVFIGYLNYTDIVNVLTTIKGKTYCAGLSLGMDHVLGKYFKFGYSFSYISGSLRKIKTSGKIIELEEKEGLDRLEFNIGLRFFMNYKK